MCMASIVVNLIYVAENFRETLCKVLEIEIAPSRRRLSCFLKHRYILNELMFPGWLPLSSRWNRSICLHVWKDADAPLIRLLAFPRSFISTAWVSVWHIWLQAVSVCVCVFLLLVNFFSFLTFPCLSMVNHPGLVRQQNCEDVVFCESSKTQPFAVALSAELAAISFVFVLLSLLVFGSCWL